MDNQRLLVDVLLLPECNIYERYPELVQRVDYFLYNWTEEMLARTEALLRKQARALQSSSSSSADDDIFTHARSVNIAWRQFAVSRLALPPYPPERINWNKDADPVFLYGQMPALRMHVPWSSHAIRIQPGSGGGGNPASLSEPPLKPVLKHTDLQTFLTSPTLSPLSSPAFSPAHSPAMSIRESMSTSSFASDNTLDTSTLRPRLRFNDRVEQCMVVFDQEKEYLPTDAEDVSDNDEHVHHRYASSLGRRKPRARRSLVIKLASTHLKGDHRKVLSVSAASPSGSGHYFHSDDEDDYDEEDPFADLALYRTATTTTTTSSSSSLASPLGDGQKSSSRRSVSGYVQGCVESVAGQVRKFVSSTYTAGRPSSESLSSASSSSTVVADPFASSLAKSAAHAASPPNAAAYSHQTLSADVVRDPFASSSLSLRNSASAYCLSSRNATASSASATASANASSPDHVPFDDEDSIIQQFEREMQKYSCRADGNNTTAGSGAYLASQQRTAYSSSAAAMAARQQQQQQQHAKRYDSVMDDDGDDDGRWGASEFGMYHDGASDDEFDYYANEYGFGGGNSSGGASSSLVTPTSAASPLPSTDSGPRQPARMRNESIIDRAEDTIFNTVDAVKWCASFISNYTVF
ncbi:hypothetical protein LPJ53_000112 [Coemansia erecta]|uniref:Uncharacterized protein n=1 Tax=Coemansia erecta TaxID=147472 RepID=A0A9W7Y812_9FUNG|nr:hypothetical protein LPJ53_000112 [Coemansia erecta]